MFLWDVYRVSPHPVACGALNLKCAAGGAGHNPAPPPAHDSHRLFFLSVRRFSNKGTTSVYGNGWQTVLQFIGLCWGLCWGSSQENSPHRLWKRLAKQFSPFMELFEQLCLTVWATMSYCLGNCVLLFGQLCLTVWATASYCLGNCVLLLVQLCLTACGNG